MSTTSSPLSSGAYSLLLACMTLGAVAHAATAQAAQAAPSQTAPVGPTTGAAAGPTPSTPSTPPAVAAQAAPAQAQPQFDVHEYRVLGNTVLANTDIETVLYPLLGDHKTLADVEIARAALEKLYHDRGYGTVFIDIPEQDVSEQVVRLKVTEGRLNEVRIAGARFYSERKILAGIPAATPGTVPNLPALQDQLSAVNLQTGDRSVTPILKAGPVPGTVDLTLNVDDHLPFHGSLELNNQYTPGTHELRASGSLSYSNLFAQFDSISAQYQVSPADLNQVNVFAANYAWGALPGNMHPSVFFINSNSNVPTVGTLGVLGKGQIYGSRFAFPLTTSITSPQSLTFGVDYKHFQESIGLPSAPALNTPISYFNLSVVYAGAWNSDWLSGSLSTTGDFGPRGISNDTAVFENKRYKGEANFFYVKVDGSLLAHLPKGFQLVLRADGQYAVEPLITNEDFSISGADGVRGYLEAEVLSDNGVHSTLQAQTPTAQWRGLSLGDLFLFYDIGRSNIIDPLAGEPASSTLRSWGAGIDVLPGKWITGSLTWADPLVNGPNTHRGDSRILFVVRGSF